MELTRGFALGIFCSLLLLGCAGFSYHYYGLDSVDYSRGILLGDKPANDLPFTVCQPTASLAHPCIVLKTAEFFAMKQDFDDTKQKLKECEAKNAGK